MKTLSLSTLLVLSALSLPALGQTHSVNIDKIIIAPVTIENVKLKGEQMMIDESVVRQTININFAERAIHAVGKTHLAHLAVRQSDDATDGYVLKSVLRMPLTHAKALRHQAARFEKGAFLEGDFSLIDSKGNVVAHVTKNLSWGIGNWYQERPKGMSAVTAHEEVLYDYARRAADSAVRALKDELSKSN